MSRIIRSLAEADVELTSLLVLETPRRILMVKPTYFDVEYVINPHMEGMVGQVDKIQAQNEWEHLKTAYQEFGLQLDVLDGVEGLPDMVFCANQSLPYLDERGNRNVVMSLMHSERRADEVGHIRRWYEKQGYSIQELDPSKITDFEGMGDALWHPGRRLLWGGYGFRSSLEAYQVISDLVNVPVIALELTDPSFYHLDTCMCMLDESRVLIYPDAFTEQGLELIQHYFPTVINANTYEAEKLFAVNAFCPDGRNVLIQQGCTDVNQKLRDEGFKVHEFSTFEYMKSGGSVFCMKMQLW